MCHPGAATTLVIVAVIPFPSTVAASSATAGTFYGSCVKRAMIRAGTGNSLHSIDTSEGSGSSTL